MEEDKGVRRFFSSGNVPTAYYSSSSESETKRTSRSRTSSVSSADPISEEDPRRSVHRMNFARKPTAPREDRPEEDEDEDDEQDDARRGEEDKKRKRMEAFQRQSKGEERVKQRRKEKSDSTGKKPPPHRYSAMSEAEARQSEYSGGRFTESGSIVVDPIKAKFDAPVYRHLVSMQPPTTNNLTVEQLDEISEFLDRRQSARRELYSDPMVQFVRLVAGFVGTSSDKVLGVGKGNRGVASVSGIFEGHSRPSSLGRGEELGRLNLRSTVYRGGGGGIGGGATPFPSPVHVGSVEKVTVGGGSTQATPNPLTYSEVKRRNNRGRDLEANQGAFNNNSSSFDDQGQYGKASHSSYEYSGPSKRQLEEEEEEREGASPSPKSKISVPNPATRGATLVKLKKEKGLEEEEEKYQEDLGRGFRGGESEEEEERFGIQPAPQPPPAVRQQQQQQRMTGVSARDLLTDPLLKDDVLDYFRRKRLATGIQWVNRPEVTGELELSDAYYSNIYLGFEFVNDKFPGKFEGAELMDFCTNQKIRVAFAQLCANFILYGISMSFNKVTLDKAPGRLLVEREALCYKFRMYRWDEDSRDFVNESRSRDQGRSSPLLTAYGGSVYPHDPLAALAKNSIRSERLERIGYYT